MPYLNAFKSHWFDKDTDRNNEQLFTEMEVNSGGYKGAYESTTFARRRR